MPDLTDARCDRCGQSLLSTLEEGKKFTSLFPDHQCWNTEELQRDFTVNGFAAPFVSVKRKADGAIGSLEFTHMPRFYFNWREHAGRQSS